jgi:hypothetical protein
MVSVFCLDWTSNDGLGGCEVVELGRSLLSQVRSLVFRGPERRNGGTNHLIRFISVYSVSTAKNGPVLKTPIS